MTRILATAVLASVVLVCEAAAQPQIALSMLLCMNAETQEIRWRERTGAGTLIAVGGQLIVLSDTSGQIVVADLSPERFAPRHRMHVLQDGVRAVTGASFADGRLYVRNLREIAAVRVQ